MTSILFAPSKIFGNTAEMARGFAISCTCTTLGFMPFSLRMRVISSWTTPAKGDTVRGQKSWRSTLSRWQVSTMSKKPRFWISILNRKRMVLS